MKIIFDVPVYNVSLTHKESQNFCAESQYKVDISIEDIIFTICCV